MKRDDLFKHFGGALATAKAFGVTKSAVYQWGEVVPELIAYKAQVLTAGRLQVDPAAYERKLEAPAA